jgi:hypothetical protein
VLTNLSVIHCKRKDWKECVKAAEEALAVDHKWLKALYLKGKSYLEMTEYE